MNDLKRVTLYTIGYERRAIEAFIGTLLGHKIEVIADVRENPFSHKKDFSRRNMESTLAAAGIRYYHFRNLGAPKYLRDRLKLDHDYIQFNKDFITHLQVQTDTLNDMYNLMNNNILCLMCMEQDQAFCHRRLIAEKLMKLSSGKVNLEVINL